MRKGNLDLKKNAMSALEFRNTWTSRNPSIYNCREVLESVTWIWRIVGVFPITLREIFGMKIYEINKFHAVYSFLLFIMSAGNFLYVMINFDFYFRISHRFLVSFGTVMIRTIGSLLCMTASNFWRLIRHKKLSQVINEMSDQDVILEKMNCRFDLASSMKIIRAYIWITVTILFLQMSYDVYTLYRDDQKPTVAWAFWNFPLIAQICDLTILASLVGLLGVKFRALNEKLITVVMRANASSPKVVVTSNVCAENIRLISKAHYNICALGKRINSIFNWSVIVNVVTAFIILSTTLYYIFDEIQRDGETSVDRIFSYILWEFIHGAPIIVIVIICNWTSHQAIHTGKLIHEIRVENKDSRLYEIVKSFSLQLHHQKLEFTAGGFFPLDSTLLQTMVGSITTYLVILIQFQPKLE